MNLLTSPTPSLSVVLPAGLFRQHSLAVLGHLCRHFCDTSRRVAEVDCASQHDVAAMLRELRRSIDQFVQLELDPAAVEQARSGNPAGGDGRIFPDVKDASQDVVIAFSALDQLVSGPEAALREIHRMLRPDGLFLYVHDRSFEVQNVFGVVHPSRDRFLFPAPDHLPENALEFAWLPRRETFGAMQQMQKAPAGSPQAAAFAVLGEYLKDWKVQWEKYRTAPQGAPEFERIERMRETVSLMERDYRVPVTKIRTSDFAREYIGRAVSASFEILEAKLFSVHEVRARQATPLPFELPSDHAVVCQGLGMRGYSAAPVRGSSAELDVAALATELVVPAVSTPLGEPAISADDITLSSSIYGLCARKRPAAPP